VSHERAIVYGSVAYPLPQKNEQDHTHRWTVYVKGINDEDISYYVKRIQFKLHESFQQPTRSKYTWGVVTARIPWRSHATCFVTCVNHAQRWKRSRTR